MVKIYNIKDKQEYLKEVAELTQKEWGSKTKSIEEFNKKIDQKINKIMANFNNPNYCKLILLQYDTLVGFISIFPHDYNEKPELFP